HGSAEHRLAGNLSVASEGVDADALLETCPAVAASTGSACSSASVEPSYVLRALGLDEATARSSLRLCVGRFTTEAEIDFAVDALIGAVHRQRSVTPGMKSAV